MAIRAIYRGKRQVPLPLPVRVRDELGEVFADEAFAVRLDDDPVGLRVDPRPEGAGLVEQSVPAVEHPADGCGAVLGAACR